MHNAPSVTYPVGRFFWSTAIPLGAWSLGVICSALWTLESAAQGWRLAVIWTAAGATGLGMLHMWLRAAVGSLSWSGTQWCWMSRPGTAHPGAVHVVLDLQHCLLLSWSGPGAGWIWVERSAAPMHWDALRRAVYSRANPDALPGAEPPTATS